MEEHPLPVHKEEETTIEPAEIICFPEPTPYPEITRTRDPAELSFTPGRIYASGGRYYGIYKRTEAKKANTCGMVDVAEVDYSGRKISKLEWRHIYRTQRGKEYIYSPTNHEWIVYTTNVLVGLSPEGIERYGNKDCDEGSR